MVVVTFTIWSVVVMCWLGMLTGRERRPYWEELHPDLDYWSWRSIFSLMGVMGGTGLALLAPSPGFLPFPV